MKVGNMHETNKNGCMGQNEAQRGNGRMTVYEVLKVGKANSTSKNALSRLTGYVGRQLSKEVERERKEGHPILSDNSGGYYLADVGTESGRSDLMFNVLRLEAQGKSCLAAAEALKSTVVDVIGQESFDL